MDEIKLFLELIKTNGLAGVLTAILIWDKFIAPRRKKRDGTWISWEMLDSRVKDIDKRLVEHLDKERQGDVMLKSMEKDIEFQGKEIDETKENVQKIFSLISEIKTILINQGQK